MSKAEEAFSRAAMCADQAQAAQDEEWRTFFKRLRDSWVRVANNYQIAESLAADDAPPRTLAGSGAALSLEGKLQ